MELIILRLLRFHVLKRERELSRNVIQNASKPTLKIRTVSRTKEIVSEISGTLELRSLQSKHQTVLVEDNRLLVNTVNPSPTENLTYEI
jgi:hypothetical protein